MHVATMLETYCFILDSNNWTVDINIKLRYNYNCNYTNDKIHFILIYVEMRCEYRMEEIIQGKHFSITDPPEVNTVIYQVNKTKKEYLNQYPKYTVERLDHTEEIVGNYNKKTFYVDEPQKDGNQLIILSFAKDKVVINNGILLGDEVKITKKPTPFKFNTLYSEQETEYKDFQYTPNFKRPISIIDPETTEEVKPVLYFDEKTNEVKGKCKLKPYKSYFAFEIRDEG